jgi:hypothetical protein
MDLVIATLGGKLVGIDAEKPYTIHKALHHMHELGKVGQTRLTRANGDEECLLHIPDWDFHWQGMYEFQQPVVVHPGDTVHIRCEWDNSLANQRPGVEPQYVEWGDRTGDEMCLAGFYVTAE